MWDVKTTPNFEHVEKASNENSLKLFKYSSMLTEKTTMLLQGERFIDIAVQIAPIYIKKAFLEAIVWGMNEICWKL